MFNLEDTICCECSALATEERRLDAYCSFHAQVYDESRAQETTDAEDTKRENRQSLGAMFYSLVRAAGGGDGSV